ncbi:AMMECR1 domain-containing protein [mine drainage metagenome]|uniref:AMMECR1 domain-containing protein n=1 Tax=mine drainage metagenome TaxID=410659 RepID=T1BCD5_9ZZZZ
MCADAIKARGVTLKIYTLREGEALVKAARASIELHIKSPRFDRGIVKNSLSGFKDKYGVFVTLTHHPTGTLRGCIGFLHGAYPLGEAVVEAAIAAATEDPRFVPISHYELEELLIEVSILSEGIPLGKTSASRERAIKIGRDGLVIQYGFYSGLLLPEVAVEEGFNKKEFLAAVCEKAGLPNAYWTQPNVKIYRFETQIFKELEPNGKIEELDYSDAGAARRRR